MRRKEFMQQLLKISELNRQVNPIRDAPFLFCRQTNIEERPTRKETNNPLICYFTRPDADQEPKELKRKEVLILISEKNIRRPGSAVKHQTDTNRKKGESGGGSSNRLKTTPHSSSRKLKGDFESGSVMKLREMQGNGVLKVHHCLHVKQIHNSTPKEERKLQASGQALVSGSRRRYGESNYGKKYSLTQPTEQVKNSFGGIQMASSSIIEKKIQASVHKYESVGRCEGREEVQRRNKLSMRKQINRNYTKPYVPPPKITAKSYIIYQLIADRNDSKVVVSFNSKSAQQVASLTKIMTCVVTLQICQSCEVNRIQQEVTIGRMEAGVGGTTASLRTGHIYTIDQLLLGLMLPSGNDASVALAVWGGRKLLERQQLQRKQVVGLQETLCQSISTNRQTSGPKFTKPECYNRFLQEMNAKAQTLGMTKTNYANSHGLMNTNNKSSAFDIALLCDYAMRKQEFRNIVQCQSYKGTIKVLLRDKTSIYQEDEDSQGQSSMDQVSEKKFLIKKLSISPKKKEEGNLKRDVEVVWQNTHKLMQLRPKQYIGIKTGFTKSAGPCLSSCISVNNREFVIVVLGCARMSLRFKETEMLKRWLYKHLKLKKSKGTASGEGEGGAVEQEPQLSKCEMLIDELNGDQQVQD